MTQELAVKPTGDIMERVLLAGDLSRLTPQDRVSYYKAVCESVGLNPLTRPFDYLSLSGKLTLYANRACTEQLRTIHEVSIVDLTREVTEGIFIVTAQAKNGKGRTDASIGAVPIDKLQGEARANAMMKAETKAKRRVTLSICGLGWLDESEVDSIPGAQRMDAAAVESEPPQKAGKPPVKLIDKPAPEKPPAAPQAQPEPSPAKPDPVVEVLPPEMPPPPPDDDVVGDDPWGVPSKPEAEVAPTPITRETQQAIYKGVSSLNKAKGAGTAQRLILELVPSGNPINKLTETEGKRLVKAMADREAM